MKPLARPRHGLAVGFALALALQAPRGALAQQAPESPPPATPAVDGAPQDPVAAQARVDFEAGLAAMRDERYADAVQAFERSYRARRVGAVALNLGITLRALGRLVEARARFQEFLELASPPQHERYDREVAGYLADIGRRVGRLRLTVTPESAVVTLDGRRAVPGVDGTIASDPGERRLEASHEGYETARETLTVTGGAEREVRLTLRRAQAAPDPRVSVPAQPEGPPSRTPGWVLPVAITGGVLVAAGAVVLAAVLLSGGSSVPEGVNTGRVIMTVDLAP